MGNVDTTIELRRLRRELIEDGADPVWISAELRHAIAVASHWFNSSLVQTRH